MTLFSPKLRPLTSVLAAIVLLSSLASAIDAGDMDPHLPDEAILAAMRFQVFSRAAEDRRQWERKHADLLEMLESQLALASVSDNRAATALRTLIKDLKDAKYVPRRKPVPLRKDEFPILAGGDRVMVREDFHINKPESRRLTYPFEIKNVPALIKVGIGGGSDDSGDGGLHYMLIDPIGRVIKSGFTKSDDYVWEQHQSTRSGKWKLIIHDLDTDLRDKKSPGNHGAVEVLVKPD